MTRHSSLLSHLLIGLSLAPSVLPQPSGPLRIGLICPLSGSLSEEGQDFDDGFRYWYDTVSEAGGVRVGGGEELTPVELVELDSESNGTRAVSNARAMVDRQVGEGGLIDVHSSKYIRLCLSVCLCMCV